MIYLKLFWTFLKIGLFGFGGGYAMLSLIQHEVVENRAWLSNQEFTDIVAISQITPGPIAVNSATYVGYTVTGNAWGSALATFAVCLPPLVLMLLLTKFFIKFRKNRRVGYAMDGLKPVMIGMIGAAVFLLMTPANFPDLKAVLLFLICLAASEHKINPIVLIAASGVAGLLLY
ncbi:MAG: chromate transporter [Rikenellaceae bacterium]|jgi:chromate transporter|nr:chromate transporter [Rikenellaceae bacterium]